jgi:hypothetical protein
VLGRSCGSDDSARPWAAAPGVGNPLVPPARLTREMGPGPTVRQRRTAGLAELVDRGADLVSAVDAGGGVRVGTLVEDVERDDDDDGDRDGGADEDEQLGSAPAHRASVLAACGRDERRRSSLVDPFYEGNHRRPPRWTTRSGVAGSRPATGGARSSRLRPTTAASLSRPGRRPSRAAGPAGPLEASATGELGAAWVASRITSNSRCRLWWNVIVFGPSSPLGPRSPIHVRCGSTAAAYCLSGSRVVSGLASRPLAATGARTRECHWCQDSGPGRRGRVRIAHGYRRASSRTARWTLPVTTRTCLSARRSQHSSSQALPAACAMAATSPRT